MNISFYFGPEKILFRLLDQGMVECDSTMPFHGIISRGLLNSFIDNDLSYQLWYKYAPYLNSNAITQDSLSDEFQKIQKLVQECAVLSFGKSAICVKIYVEKYCRIKKVKEAQVDCWNIKEGHTSSVWKVTVSTKNTVETFVVNVARDRGAGFELKETSQKLKTIGEQIPTINIARVYDIQVIQDTSLPGEVVVTRNEWIENSYEIHSRKNKQTGEDELLMVERFLINENNPAHITSVVGRIFSTEEVQKIETDLNDFITNAAKYLPDKIDINIKYGDLVWNGKRALVVAIS